MKRGELYLQFAESRMAMKRILFVLLLLSLIFVGQALQAAIVTTTISAFANGSCRVEINYNDGTLAITRLRIINNSARLCRAFADHTVSLVSRSLTAQPGQTTTLNLPNGFLFTTDPDDGSLRLGPVRLGAKWE